jgi:hypothetical protein
LTLLDKILGHQARDLSLLLLASLSNDVQETQMPLEDEYLSVAQTRLFDDDLFSS